MKKYPYRFNLAFVTIVGIACLFLGATAGLVTCSIIDRNVCTFNERKMVQDAYHGKIVHIGDAEFSCRVIMAGAGSFNPIGRR